MVRLQGIFVVAVALFLSMMLPSGSWSVVEEGEWGAPEPDLRGLDYVVVDPSGGGDYKTIQEAIDAVNENGTVLVKAGTYTEKLYINKSLRLIGEASGEVRLIVDAPDATMITVNASYVTIENIIIDGSRYNLTEYISGLATGGIAVPRHAKINNLNILNCTFRDIVSGILVSGESLILQNSNFQNTLFGINCFLTGEGKIYKNNFVFNYSERIGSVIIFINAWNSIETKLYVLNNTYYGGGVNRAHTFMDINGMGNHHIEDNIVVNGDIIRRYYNIVGNVTIVRNRFVQSKVGGVTNFVNNTMIDSRGRADFVRGNVFYNSSLAGDYVVDNVFYNSTVTERNVSYIADNVLYNSTIVWVDTVTGNHLFGGGIINSWNVVDNVLENCTYGIKWHQRVLFMASPWRWRNVTGNILKNCGIEPEYDIRDEYYEREVFERVRIEGNTVNGKPVLFYKFNDGIDLGSEDEFAQVIALKCSNVTVHGIRVEGAANYPIVYVSYGSDVEIYDNDFGGGSPVVRLESVHRGEIRGNRLRGLCGGIVLNRSEGVSVYGNIFEVGNGSFYDSGGNDWYSGVEGNLWTNVSLRDEDLDGYGDEPVRIPGGGGEDMHPAYPYMRLEVRSYVEEGTTGEGIPLGLKVWVPDYSFEVISDVKLVWMRGEERWERDFGAVEGEWDFVIGLNESSTEPVRIWMEGRDLYGGEYRSEEIVVEVVDNDPPEVVGVDMPGSLANGDEFEVKVYARDNVGVEGVELEVRWDEGYRSVLRLEYDGGVWRGSLRVPDNVSGEALVVLRVEDLGGNVVYYNSTTEVRDTVGPVIEEDETPTVVDCGEVLEFRIRVWDASGVGRVVVYLSGGVVDVVELEEEGGYYVGEYEVPVEVTVLRYYVYAEDVVGNSVSGEEREVEVRDVIPPYIEFREVPESVGTGEFLRVGVVYGDNVGVGGGWVLVLINGEEWRNLTLGDVEVEMPEDEVGSVILRGVVVDVSGWRDEFESVEIELVDVISPEIELGRGEVRLREGEELRMEINVSDNIGVESVEWWWSGDGKWREGREIELRVGKAGEYQIKVRAYDGAGNVEEVNVTVVVERGEGSGDGGDGGGGLWVWVAVLGVAVAVVFVAVLYVKGRGGGGMFEEPGGEEDLSGEGMGS